MSQQNQQSGTRLRVITLFALPVLTLMLLGCGAKSWFWDPNAGGHFKDDTIRLPILDRLDLIDDPADAWLDAEDVRPEDLVADAGEYKVGLGDIVTVSVFELLTQGAETAQTRQVDPTGMIRLPTIGPVKVVGRTARELEKIVAETIASKKLLTDPTVSVTVQQSQHRTYSILGGETGPTGTFAIPINDYRVLDALAATQAAVGSDWIYIIRRLKPSADELTNEGADAVEELEQLLEEPSDAADERTLEESLEDAKQGPEQRGGATTDGTGPGAAVGASNRRTSVPREGRWVPVDTPPTAPDGAAPPDAAELDLPTVDRHIIRVPLDRLLAGDLRYNVVIRPGDIIRFPPPVTGNVYLGGQVNGGGTFALPGERMLTVKQLIFAAGGFSPIAKPDRAELTRRVGGDEEVTVQIDIKAMFAGEQPDFFLKPNDMINVGTGPLEPFLAVIRNGLRFSYGAGFIYDQNFNDESNNN